MMIHRLELSQYERALPVVANVDHALAATAVLEGTCPGQVYVDDVGNPRTVFAVTPEGHWLVGDDSNSKFNTSLEELLANTILPEGVAAGWWYFTLLFWPETWVDKLDGVFESRHIVKDSQKFYTLRRPKADTRAEVPAGFEMARVDGDVLARTDLENVDKVVRWANGNFGSVEAFLRTGFGFCTLHGSDIMSWCMADCVSRDRCEIGIHTDERYRRQGLATLTAAATVDYCLANGVPHIGWHCHSHNRPSAATAEKIGFEHVLDHPLWRVWFNEVDPPLVNGNLAFMGGRFEEAAQCYERALRFAASGVSRSHLLAGGRDIERYQYQAACARSLAGDRNSALAHLNAAIDASIRQGGY